jgi:chemotaxis protein histidine kinase CheA
LELGEVFLLAWDAGSDPILDMFIFETLQLADQLEKVVLTNEKYSSFKMEKINEVFRIMHTIKGSAAMMFFNNISAVAHSMEDLFFYIRENELLELDYSELCDLILAGIDFIKMETVKIQEGGEADSVPDKLLQQIQGFLDSINKMVTKTCPQLKPRRRFLSLMPGSIWRGTSTGRLFSLKTAVKWKISGHLM